MTTLRPAQPQDDRALRALFGCCFDASPKTDEAVVRWQYWENPFGEVRSWVWEDEGKLVAHYAGMPVPLLAAGVPAVGAVGIDAATLSSYRGQGLFEQLCTAVYRDCGEHGIPVTLCYPNANSLRGFVKAGGLPVGELATFVLATDADWLARRFHLPRPVAAVLAGVAFRAGARAPARAGSARECEGVPSGIPTLWEEAGHATRWGIRRDRSWWEWRYERKPAADYRFFECREGGRLRGAAVTAERQDFGGRFVMLLELMTDGPEPARELVAAVARSAGDTNGVVTVALPGSPVAMAAREGGLRRLPPRLAPKPLHFGVADNLGNQSELRSAQWSVAWGDLDHL
jgi:hypothetical protein